MKKLLTDIIKSIAEKPDQVKVSQKTDDSGMIVFTLVVDPQDMGRIIGKQGKMISAIRALIRTAARKQDTRVHIELQEPQEISDPKDQESS